MSGSSSSVLYTPSYSPNKNFETTSQQYTFYSFDRNNVYDFYYRNIMGSGVFLSSSGALAFMSGYGLANDTTPRQASFNSVFTFRYLTDSEKYPPSSDPDPMCFVTQIIGTADTTGVGWGYVSGTSNYSFDNVNKNFSCILFYTPAKPDYVTPSNFPSGYIAVGLSIVFPEGAQYYTSPFQNFQGCYNTGTYEDGALIYLKLEDYPNFFKPTITTRNPFVIDQNLKPNPNTALPRGVLSVVNTDVTGNQNFLEIYSLIKGPSAENAIVLKFSSSIILSEISESLSDGSSSLNYFPYSRYSTETNELIFLNYTSRTDVELQFFDFATPFSKDSAKVNATIKLSDYSKLFDVKDAPSLYPFSVSSSENGQFVFCYYTATDPLDLGTMPTNVSDFFGKNFENTAFGVVVFTRSSLSTATTISSGYTFYPVASVAVSWKTLSDSADLGMSLSDIRTLPTQICLVAPSVNSFSGLVSGVVVYLFTYREDGGRGTGDVVNSIFPVFLSIGSKTADKNNSSIQVDFTKNAKSFTDAIHSDINSSVYGAYEYFFLKRINYYVPVVTCLNNRGENEYLAIVNNSGSDRFVKVYRYFDKSGLLPSELVEGVPYVPTSQPTGTTPNFAKINL